MDIWSSLLRGAIAGAGGGPDLRRLFVFVTGMVLALGGLAVLFAALYLFLLEHLRAPAAAAITGGVLLAVASGLILAARSPRGATRKSQAGANPEGNLLDLVEALRREIAAHPMDSVTAAFLVGAILGASPRARRTLKDLLR